MQLDLRELHFDPQVFTPQEIEECLEDPFGVRLLPSDVNWTDEARYFCLAQTLHGRFLMIVYWSDGKLAKIIAVRDMSESEKMFYHRQYASMI